MDPLQKITLTLSQQKSRMNALGMKDDLSPEEVTELEGLANEYQALELRHQALLMTSETLTPAVADSESRELAQLETRAQLSGVIGSILADRRTQGPESELQEHLGLSGNQIPLSMLAATSPLEQRAVSTVGADTQRTQAGVIPYVFPASAAAWLGVQQPSVPVGLAAYPVMTGPAIPASPVAGALSVATGVDAEGYSTAVISTTSLSPRRLQAAFFFSIEDRSKLRGLEEALRMNLRDALSDGLDQFILADATDGLLAGGLTPATDPSGVAAYLGYQSAVFDSVDGRYAMTPNDIKLLWGSASMRHASTVYRSTDSDSGYESVMKNSAGTRVSSHVPAPASNIQVALAVKGAHPGAIAPIWNAIELIPDSSIPLISKGHVALTGIMLYAFDIFRADSFVPLKFKLA